MTFSFSLYKIYFLSANLILIINKLPYKHIMWIPRWNDVETTISISFQRGIHAVCL